MILLGPAELTLAALLVMASALLAWVLRLGISASLLIAGTRMVIQLLLVGLILKTVFERVELTWIALIALVMLLVAGYEVTARQKRPMAGLWSMAVGVGAMFLSSFAVAVLTLTVILGPSPWYTPQYAIPLLGMLLGNTMTGVALSLDRLTQTSVGAAHDGRGAPHARPSLERSGGGHPPGLHARRHDSHPQRHGRRRHRQPAGNDDRADSGGHAAGGGGQIPDSDHVPDHGCHRRGHGAGGPGRLPAAVRCTGSGCAWTASRPRERLACQPLWAIRAASKPRKIQEYLDIFFRPTGQNPGANRAKIAPMAGSPGPRQRRSGRPGA